MNNLNLKNNHKWLSLSAAATVVALGSFTPSAEAANFTLDFNSGINGSDVLFNSNGTLATDQWADWGLTDISGVNDRTDKAAKFNLYNTTTNAGGQDGDLRTGSNWGTTSQGNALIIQEENWSNKQYFNNNGVYRADDEAAGGFVNFDFASSVAFKSFSLLDIDDNGGGISVGGYDTDGNQVLDIDIDALIAEHKSVNGTNATAAQGTSVSMNGVTLTQLGNRHGDNSMFRFDVDQAHLANVRFNYPGSGAISGLEWSTGEEEPQDIPEPSAMGGLLMLGFVGSRKYLKRKQAGTVESA